MLPDDDTDSTPYTTVGYYTRTGLETILEYQYSGTGTDGNWQHNPYPGVIISRIGTSDGGTCPGGAVCFPYGAANDYASLTDGGYGFETQMGLNMCGWMHERGMLSANGERFCNWYVTGPVSGIVSTALPDYILAATVYHWTSNVPPSGGVAPPTADQTWASGYQYIESTTYEPIGAQSPAWGQGRLISGTMSFTGTNSPGGTIHVTVPAGNYFNNGGTAFYAGGYLLAVDPTLGVIGSATISSVTGSNTFDATVVQAFTGGPYTNTAWVDGGFTAGQKWYVPFAKPPDANGLEIAGLHGLWQGAISTGYFDMCLGGLTQASQYWPSITGMSTALTALQGLNAAHSPVVWNYAVRP